VLNKTDLVSERERETVEELLAGLRPDAEIVPTSYSAVDPDRLLGRRLYDPARAAEAAGWRQVLADDEAGSSSHDDHAHDREHEHDQDHAHDGHSHPQEAYGVTSFAYRRRRPFRAAAVADVLASLPPAVVRSKGTLWVAGSELNLTFGQAGASAHVEAAGPWVATLPDFEQDAYRRNRSGSAWDDEWGDRRTELVFIGTGIDEAALVDALDDCLVDDADLDDYDPESWEADPFPAEQGEQVVLAEP
jgi:G3E family GTPase